MQYIERLNFLKLDTLVLRRLKADLIFAYKIIFQKVDLDKHIFYHAGQTGKGSPVHVSARAVSQ